MFRQRQGLYNTEVIYDLTLFQSKFQEGLSWYFLFFILLCVLYFCVSERVSERASE